MKKLAKSKRILHLTIQAVKEGAALLEHLGYPLEPASLNKLLKCPGWLMYLPIKLAVQTKTVKLAVRDHAMAAIGEMNQLTNEFVQLKSRAQMKTPALDELATYLIRHLE